MNHEILLATLKFYGILGVSADWFRSYLTKRRQNAEVASCYSTQNVFSGLGTLKHGVPQRPILGSLLVIIYMNGLLLRINSVSEPILFAVDTSVIISSRNFKDFCSVSDLVLCCMIKWFAANNFFLNLDKTNIMRFITKNSPLSTLLIGYKEKYIKETVTTKFLGLQIDNHINWKNH